MKQTFYMFLLIVFTLPACATPPAHTPPAPVEITSPALPAHTEPVSTPNETRSGSKLPAPSFDAQPYVNEEAGFALDIPSDWTTDEQVIGPRGTQIRFLSSPDLADVASLPAGATRLSAMIYLWEPKNDLKPYVARQKTTWEAPGFAILEEEQSVRELGLPVEQFVVQSPDEETVFLITALKDQYLVLSGEGDLDLVKEIVGRVRPISQ